jgi:ADP-ribosylglycohydrolase
MIVGMVLGAYSGMESLPRQWIDELDKKDRVLKLIDELTSLNN